MTIRLILADDHRMLREGLTHSMVDAGFDVVAQAGDGAEAVRLAERYAPDVVLMDVSMSTTDGVEACRQMRSIVPNTRVVMLTMHTDPETLSAALRAGAVGYLVKDCTTDEVAEAVRLAANGDTVLSPQLAESLLAEVRRLNEPQHPVSEERIVSEREEEVLQLITDGGSTPEVAAKMYISQKTVKNHLASIYQKLGARDRTQAVLAAMRLGIVTLN
ncbi:MULTISPECIES: response regulator transcription factor [Candidatus Neomicrothrix]|jgi:two-component system response regulator DegU|uniref:Putative Transcriptional regulatory protein degU n=1 Tax=Candidatus Neomicrothrix parvicella RN1 TaxID=1229780 RepID=R4Z1Q5_9ACTN|nr:MULTISPECIES: response regulator transcription factor [Microthrix]MBK6502569.1 response regulator transcription factor [Candidatus Microthrix sp.]MBK7020272.1 response regulator transcription factor [Candidatus Microthrix sp.]MBK7323956.1 response regulator transcription factor [Candidatus Microthrix sp.]MBL0203088.1 response regulator transcription factor [Candidatus Microthrix sp.]MBP6135732.1 response regulator transcription factor [Candidatus Microthrix sp.]